MQSQYEMLMEILNKVPNRYLKNQYSPLNPMEAFYTNMTPKDPTYDMGGFNLSNLSKSLNPNDNRIHYPDVYKTPFEFPNFSNESKYANPMFAPRWGNNDSELIDPITKKPVYSEVRSLMR